MPLRRETCRACWRPNPLGFSVPDHIWSSVVPEALADEVLCIVCFDGFATEAGVDWVPFLDRENLAFVSGADHHNGGAT